MNSPLLLGPPTQLALEGPILGPLVTVGDSPLVVKVKRPPPSPASTAVAHQNKERKATDSICVDSPLAPTTLFLQERGQGAAFTNLLQDIEEEDWGTPPTTHTGLPTTPVRKFNVGFHHSCIQHRPC